MPNILEVTFIPPDKRSGGGLGIYQSICSLLANGEVDYIGPAFEEGLFGAQNRKPHVLCPLETGKNGMLRRAVRFITKQISTGYYCAWEQFLPEINWQKYDFLHVESGRYFFVMQEARKHKKRILVRMHNIEADYAKRILIREKSLGSFIRYKSYSSNEKKSVCVADGLIFLTTTDIQRARALYGVEPSRSFLNPVCLDIPKGRLKRCKEKANGVTKFLMTGSLSYGPNTDGIIWLLENVWQHLPEQIHGQRLELVIAGSHPRKELVDRANWFQNVRLEDTPPDMFPFFEEADIYLAPIFDGAGMKVKVAEALSYGLPVIGTSHAWTGYEMADKGKMIADTANEFMAGIEQLSDDPDALGTYEEILDVFQANLSMESSGQRLGRIINEMWMDQ